MSGVLVDTHVLQWWSISPERVSEAAARALQGDVEISVSAATWYELAWLIARGRLELALPARAWLDSLARDVRTIPITTPIATRAAELPAPFPGDPIDRLIYATAVETGLTLVSGDRRMRAADQANRVVW